MRTTFLLSLALLACFLGCIADGLVAPQPENGLLNFMYTAEDTLEGAEFALWLEGKLLATDSTTSRTMRSLKYLRYKYGDSVWIYPSIAKVLGTRFMPPWEIGQLAVRFDSATGRQVKDGLYTGWDSLDASLRPDTILMISRTLTWTVLGFDESYNPIRLSEFYRNLPGVVVAEPSWRGWMAIRTFPMFPGLKDGELSYVLLEDGLLGLPYLYFRDIHGEPQLIGVWDPQTEQAPSWWTEASENKERFSSWDGI